MTTAAPISLDLPKQNAGPGYIFESKYLRDFHSPSAAWRRPLSLLRTRETEPTVQISSIRVPNLEKYSTCIQALADTPFVAVGCGSETNNLFIVENLATSSADGVEPSTENAATLKTKSAFSVPDPIYSMSFAGDKLITAGPNSRLQLFKIGLSEIGQRGRGLEHLFDCKLNSGKLSDVKVAPPGTRVSSVRVQCVEFAPTGDPTGCTPASRFMAVHGRKVFLWDMESQKPLASEAVSHDQIVFSSWSPHQPYGSLIAASGVDHHLSVLDSRLMGTDTGKSVVWKVERAHGGHNHPAITSVRFNPFIPYWLASAGEDSVVRLWDLRYLKYPCGKIEGHYLGVQTMTWSNTHAEILVTGSSDCTLRAWRMDSNALYPVNVSKNSFVGSSPTAWANVVPNMINKGDAKHLKIPETTRICIGAELIAESSGYSSPVISCSNSWSHQHTYYALSQTGEFSSVTLTRSLFSKLAPHKFSGAENSQEALIETSIYSRNLTKAFEDLVSYSKDAFSSYRTVGVNETALISLINSKPPIDLNSWSIAGNSIANVGGLQGAKGDLGDEGTEKNREMILRFSTDVLNCVESLPPGYASIQKWHNLVPPKTRSSVELVISRHGTLLDIMDQNWESALKSEETICNGIESDVTIMDPEYIKLLIETVLPNDFVRGLQFGHKMARRFLDFHSGKFSMLSSVVYVLLFPTVFDSAVWIIDASNLETNWSDGRGSNMRRRMVRGLLDEESAKAPRYVEAPESCKETIVSDPEAVMSMISVEIRIAQLLASKRSNADIAENLIQIVTGEINESSAGPNAHQKHSAIEQNSQGTEKSLETIRYKYRHTYSVTTNRLYLDALLLTKRFEEYFSLSIELSTIYQLSPFSKILLAHMESAGISSLRRHMESFNAKSMEILSDVESLTSGSSSILGQTISGATRPLRQGLVIIVKVGHAIAVLMETKGAVDKEGVELCAKGIGSIGNIFGFMATSLFNVLDEMDKRLGKQGTTGAYARDAASLAQEEIRQSCKGYGKPSEAKTRATASVVSGATGAGLKESGTGASFMEQVFVILDKLSKIAKPI